MAGEKKELDEVSFMHCSLFVYSHSLNLSWSKPLDVESANGT
jgi:hypothetical protein